MQPLLLYTLLFAPLAATAITPRNLPHSLTVTALVGKNNLSSLECWAFTPPLVESTATGTIGALSYAHLGATGNGSYSLFTQHTDAGLHNAPAPQYVVLLTGRGVLSFPSADPADSDSTLSGNYTVSAGDILIAMDVVGTSVRGHNSVWQAGTSTLQMPFAGEVPEHVVLYDGGCQKPHM
ncbi:small secreted protein [Mycena amicta]|nr:small secreted protein [Mycena amicta]